MKAIKIIIIILIAVLLTVLTQAGGILYLISLTTHPAINKKISRKTYNISVKAAMFLLIYFGATFFIVPALAKQFGRVQLPIAEEKNLAPRKILFALLNRNYVRPELKNALLDIAERMNKKHPGTIVYYLDANFPFINKFPLLPHLSHNDGRKIDISFFYKHSETGLPSLESPSPIGYGVSEEPHADEPNTNCACTEKGHWQYGLINRIVWQSKKKEINFDESKTREFILLCSKHPSIKTMFLEPHLKLRMKLESKKIKFHGCHAARHDDHIHIQLN